MHRHGYQGSKFNRKTDQRGALIKGLAEALIVNESIETTFTKAKAVVPYTEKLVTRAKSGKLEDRRLIMARLQTKGSANKLVDEIAPKLTGRTSGHFRIERTSLRRGDNAQMAKIMFVDNLSEAPVKSVETKTTDKETLAKEAKPTTKKASK
ncbi:MAG TPA: 50S ribosomal protein L17 [Candidatus Saccharimonadales bacterium]|nr:50S ribosomal protein L17 [Candidatus Saccharimonadales bacterium]